MCDVATPERSPPSRQATALLAKDGGLRNSRTAPFLICVIYADSSATGDGSVVRQSSAETPSLAALLGRLKRGDKAAAKPARCRFGAKSAMTCPMTKMPLRARILKLSPPRRVAA